MKPDAGEILLNGIPLKENSPLIGYTLQHDHLLDWRSIYRNVTLGPEICGTLNTATKKRASELLEQYGLKQFASARPSQLSGGMRQRAALIRTLLPEMCIRDRDHDIIFHLVLSCGSDHQMRQDRKCHIFKCDRCSVEQFQMISISHLHKWCDHFCIKL